MQSIDDGSLRAPIALVLEAYGHWEEVYGRPLVGPTYNDKIVPMWRDCRPSLSRSDVYITNTWDQGQPSRIDGIGENDMRGAFERLHRRLAALEGPKGEGPLVIVAGGNYALYALTGKGQVSFHNHDGRHKRPGILDWRGSILSYTDLRGRTIKVIPTPHPAMLFRRPEYEWVLRRDWQRIVEDAQFRELRLPQRTRMIAPSKSELFEWLKWTRAEAKKRVGGWDFGFPCSLDVETPNKVTYETRQAASKSEAPGVKCRRCTHTRRWHTLIPVKLEDEGSCSGLRGKGGCACTGFQAPLGKPRQVKVSEEAYLGCIGWAWRPDLSMTAPTTKEYWGDNYAAVMAEIAAFHADKNIAFGGQNFWGFDCWWCVNEGIPVKNPAWDLMKMHRVERPYSSKNDLAFQASIDTREPFWKHEAKLPDEISRWSHNKEQLWSYNGTDNCVQIELLPIRMKGLKEGGRWDYYTEMEAPIEPKLLPLSRWGMRADMEGRKTHYERVKTEAIQLGKEINEAGGTKLVARTAVSRTKLAELFYERLMLPPQYTKNSKKQKVLTVNVVAVKRLMEQFPACQQLQEVGRRVLRHRRLGVEANFVKESAVDADGRTRGHFRQDTALGRLKCSTNPKKEGRNLQNIDRTLRAYYWPDTGEEVVPI